MATVTFRGPMLFLTKDGAVVEARMPNTLEAPAFGSVHNGQRYHLDGTDARVHYPTLFYWSGGREHRRSLDGTRVSFANPAKTVPEAAVASFVSLNKTGAHANLAINSAAPCACLVDLNVPDTFTNAVSSHPPEWEFRVVPSDGPYDSSLTLNFDGEVSLELTSAVNPPVSILLGSDEWASVDHLDGPFPSTDAVEDSFQKNPVVPVPIRDIDFCWLYSMLQPATGGLPDYWGAYRPFAAPSARRVHAAPTPGVTMLPSVSTCLPATIAL